MAWFGFALWNPSVVRQFVSVKREVTMPRVAPYSAVSVVLYSLHWVVYLRGEIIVLSDIRVNSHCHVRVFLKFRIRKLTVQVKGMAGFQRVGKVFRLLVKVAVRAVFEIFVHLLEFAVGIPIEY